MGLMPVQRFIIKAPPLPPYYLALKLSSKKGRALSLPAPFLFLAETLVLIEQQIQLNTGSQNLCVGTSFDVPKRLHMPPGVGDSSLQSFNLYSFEHLVVPLKRLFDDDYDR